MHNNSPRMGVPLHSQTSTLVGPTTYIICDGRDDLVNRVAFLSTEERNASFIKKPFCDTFYTLPDSTRDIRGGSSQRNKSPRFFEVVDDIPGPQHYSPKLPTCVDKKRSSAGRGKLYLCKVPYTLKVCGPSIPTKNDENGYYLDENKNIVKIPPNLHDTSLGPAFYNTTEKPTYIDQYRGCKWSGRTSKRSFYETKSNPGPADYDVKFPKYPISKRDEEFREMARLLTYLPRFLDSQEMKLKKEDLPGPGQYDITKIACKRCEGIHPKPFINASNRFNPIVSDTPSPGIYDVTNTKINVSKKDIPFSVQAPRFTSKIAAQSPGPGEYSIKSPLYQNLNYKKNQFAIYEPPFCTTAPRNTVGLSRDIINMPASANYCVDCNNRCKLSISSVFKSKVKRFPKKCSKMDELSPAHYDIRPAYDINKNPKSHNIHHIPFNAKAKKKGVLDSINYENPAPTTYLSQGNLSCKSYKIPLSGRFPEDKRNIPGPGTYHIHPSQSISIYGAFRTHNLRLKEDILKKSLRKHPRETWEKWANTLEKRKIMKCFGYAG